MKNISFVLIFLVVIVASGVVTVHLYRSYQIQEVITQRNAYCQSISEEIEANITLENIKRCDCYYADCQYPDQDVMELVEFTCVCDCLLKNNNTSTVCIAKFRAQNP